MNIGNAVKILRKNKRISQKELAKLCDISANALCSIEQGESFPEKIQLSEYVKLWKFQNPICYCSVFQQKIFPKISGFFTIHCVNLLRKT